MESSSTFKRIFSANRDIEKIPAPLRSHISSLKSPNCQDGLQVCRQGQGSRSGCYLSSHTYPCKTLFPTIRLTLLRRLSMCVTQSTQKGVRPLHGPEGTRKS
ncbi:hypothetical protein AVEN_220881-1 [Araneus ventricosus]|uniref:Uncharacterized protein n=1 Tax=Araneus ventricosus TaxID=182803 RepID=A0A4Y2B4Q8_ARAVE|nr:hypothetical protein AVEN_241619-1 [Araneus ventricosus]GBL86346.1 hypothetical protein AVEN_90858-1 [Araneus ventricosus]GBL86425.1 hypothetical protein AVEN_208334-1 [Araneus ventricosus]GBL86439.1 hypothetical protein AVEN_220881-1 [Araneus ventricosus]